jgi:hypothetical protein
VPVGAVNTIEAKWNWPFWKSSSAARLGWLSGPKMIVALACQVSRLLASGLLGK